MKVTTVGAADTEVHTEVRYPHLSFSFYSSREQLQQEVQPGLDRFYSLFLQAESA